MAHPDGRCAETAGGVLIWRCSDPDAPKRPGRYSVCPVKLGHDETASVGQLTRSRRITQNRNQEQGTPDLISLRHRIEKADLS